MLEGTVSQPGATVQVVINGTLRAQDVTTADADGNWSLTLPISSFPIGLATEQVTAFAPEIRAVSGSFFITTEAGIVGEPIVAEDPAGDDTGPYGVYTLPGDASFNDQLDILSASITPSGGNLLVEVTMAERTVVWAPPNQFDHVLFHIFIDVPGVASGVTALPNINAEFSGDFTWDYLAFVEGWSNRLFSAEGAGPASYGTNINPAAELSVEGETIRFLFTANALGNPPTMEGARVYIATWDWNGPDASYRSLFPVAGQWSFGGGDQAAGYPLIFDDIAINWEPDGAAIQLDEGIVAETSKPDHPITFVVSVPENTPADAELFLAGAFSNQAPNDGAYAFSRQPDGTYTLTVPFRQDTPLEYRITRGSWANAERIDPADRFAQRTYTVTEPATVELNIEGWWDNP
ncbi:MAG: hypothetical protein HC918_06625 [Oscillatoriales cyanobacterium SM2_1_8]|nr:hypothetical protein [Oscillatoriales cyanobacterium SM2_1_8]